jgi:hypothetical protein
MALDVVVVQVLQDIMADTTDSHTAVEAAVVHSTTAETVLTEDNQVAVAMLVGVTKILLWVLLTTGLVAVLAEATDRLVAEDLAEAELADLTTVVAEVAKATTLADTVEDTDLSNLAELADLIPAVAVVAVDTMKVGLAETVLLESPLLATQYN